MTDTVMLMTEAATTAPASAVAGFTARVRSLGWEADGVLSVELHPLDGQARAWAPGAHIDLAIAGAPVRQYSLCGVPGSTTLRVAVRREEDSRGGSRAVHTMLRPGDEVTVHGPRNHFALDSAADYLFIAGGIGITPMLPMIRVVQDAGARWRLLYLGSARSTMAFLDEVIAINPSAVTIVAKDESARADLAAETAAHPDALIYACGPERMLAELTALVPEDRLRIEYFSAPAVEYTPGAAFTIRLARSGTEHVVEPEQSVLEVMRAAGADIVSDCEEGICGSCETTVLEGEIEHRDHILTPQERARNDCLMTCVSRANCAVLVLDA